MFFFILFFILLLEPRTIHTRTCVCFFFYNKYKRARTRAHSHNVYNACVFYITHTLVYEFFTDFFLRIIMHRTSTLSCKSRRNQDRLASKRQWENVMFQTNRVISFNNDNERVCVCACVQMV